jgi:hypothetical protein
MDNDDTDNGSLGKRKGRTFSDNRAEKTVPVEVFDLPAQQFADQTVFPIIENRKKENISNEIGDVLAEYFLNNPGISEEDQANIVKLAYERTINLLKANKVEIERATDQEKAQILLQAIEADIIQARNESRQIWERAAEENLGMAAELPPAELAQYVLEQRKSLEEVWARTRKSYPTQQDVEVHLMMSRVFYDQIYKALMDMLRTIGGRIDEYKFHLILSVLGLLGCSGIPQIMIPAVAMTGIINEELKKPGLNPQEQQTLSQFFTDNIIALSTCGINAIDLVCRPIYKITVSANDLANKTVLRALEKTSQIGSRLARTLFDTVQESCFPESQDDASSVSSRSSRLSVVSTASSINDVLIDITTKNTSLKGSQVIQILGSAAQSLSSPLSRRDSSGSEGYESTFQGFDEDSSMEDTAGGRRRRGRKSRRYKKKRSTLKRRGLKRRRTRKGKKMRHTKKRR